MTPVSGRAASEGAAARPYARRLVEPVPRPARHSAPFLRSSRPPTVSAGGTVVLRVTTSSAAVLPIAQDV